MFIEYSSINDEDTPAYYDQDNCYWDSFHYLTIREKAVPAVDRGSHIYGVRKTIKSNVIEVTEATAFFSNRKDMLDSLSAKIESSHPTGLADLKTREAMTQSEVFSVEVFILQ